MGMRHEQRTVYTCDGCGHEAEVDPMGRHTWLTIGVPGEETVTLCSWACVAKHGAKKDKETREVKA